MLEPQAMALTVGDVSDGSIEAQLAAVRRREVAELAADVDAALAEPARLQRQVAVRRQVEVVGQRELQATARAMAEAEQEAALRWSPSGNERAGKIRQQRPLNSIRRQARTLAVAGVERDGVP